VQRWLSNIPERHYLKTQNLLHRFDIMALIVARFTAFVRTIMPLLIGLSGMNSKRFHILNIISGLIWVSVLVIIGYAFGHSHLFMQYQTQIMTALTLIPLALIALGVISSLFMFVRKKQQKKHNTH